VAAPPSPSGPIRLSDKIVLVTGASSGIGRAIAHAAAEAGADVAITYRRNRAGALAVVEELRATGRHADLRQVDVSLPQDLEGLTRWVATEFGRVDAWINNAGADILTGEGRALSALEKLDLVLDVDLRGTVLASWAAVELMRRQPGGGAILNMSWDHVHHGMRGENPVIYAAAKGGVAAFSKALARDVAPHIRVNVLAPGFIATAFADEVAPDEWRREVAARTPMGRWGTPHDIARAAVYLASDAAAFITGQTLMVNGGVIMQ